MIQTMREAEGYLQQFISQNKKLTFPGSLGLQRTKYFLKLLKNPQNKPKIAHIAGTSGKGSTAIYMSMILKSLGFKVGLHISPYFVDFRERFQINGRLISEKSFCKYLNEIIPAIEKMQKTRFGEPTYFEILTALAFHVFYREKVDYAVIETGLGGLLDATNVVNKKNKLCILTKIGFDHTRILGRTLEKIARQKAGIIQKENEIIASWQVASVRKIFAKQAAKNKSHLTYIKKGKNFKNINLRRERLYFDFILKKFQLEDVCLNTEALYQAENCALVLSAINFLSGRDKFQIDEKKIRESLQTKILPGRMEKINIQKKILILDGAHNPQKMCAFIKSLKKAYPQKNFSFLLAFKKDKDVKKIISYVLPQAKDIILTTFKVNNQDLLHISEKPETIAKIIKKSNFLNYEIIPDAQLALEKLLKKNSQVLVVTGSIYLLGGIYRFLKK